MSVEFRAAIGFGIYFPPGEFLKAWAPANSNSEEIFGYIDDFVYDLNPMGDYEGYFFGVIAHEFSSGCSIPKAIKLEDIAIYVDDETINLTKAYEKCFPGLAAESSPAFKFHFFSRWL